MDYWYLWLLLAVLAVLTVIVIFFASRAVSRHNAETKKQLDEIKRMKALKDKYKNISADGLKSADASEVLAGHFAVIEAKLESADNPEERFEELSAVEKNIYVLYCFCEDCSVSLSFFFKNNENSFAALITDALDKIGYKEILPLVQEEMTMFDEDNEDVSIDADKIKVCDEKFQSVFSQGRLHSLTKEYIIKNSDL